MEKLRKTTRVINGKNKGGSTYFAYVSDISVKLIGEDTKWQMISSGDDFYLSDFYSVEMFKPDGSSLINGQPYTFELNYIYDMSDDKAAVRVHDKLKRRRFFKSPPLSIIKV